MGLVERSPIASTGFGNVNKSVGVAFATLGRRDGEFAEV